MARRQGIYWLCTIPADSWSVPEPAVPPSDVSWLRGQLEQGASGYVHWQLVVALERKGSCATMQKIFGKNGHYELSRSKSAEDYVWKEDTAIEGTRFEY